MPDQVTDQRQHRDAEGEIALRGLEQFGTPDIGDAVRAMRQPDRVDHDQRDDLLERDRHHGEIVAAQPERRRPEERAGDQRHQAARDKAEPEADMEIGGADTDRVSAEAEECRLRQIDLAAQAEHDRESEHRDRERRRLHQDVEDVAVEPHARGERHQHRGRNEIRQVPNQKRLRMHCGRRDRHVVAGRAHAFSATRSPKIPCGLKIKNATSTRKAKPSLYGTEI